MKKKKNTPVPLSEAETNAAPKKKKHHGLLIFLILLIILLIGGTYYYLQRQKPQKAALAFMSSVSALDFDSMSAQIQSEDLSVLDDTIVKNEVYTDFFRSLCQKMTYTVIKNRFSLLQGTADVTLRVNYIDGTPVFKEALSDFLRKTASASISDTELTETELNLLLAESLSNAAKGAEDTYVVTEITYPMIYIEKQWKTASIDSETIKIMSANFDLMQQEIHESMNTVSEGTALSMDEIIPDTDVIDLDTDRFSIHFTQCRITKDISGKSCLLVYYDYTNKDQTASSPMIDVALKAYQNENALDAAIPETTEPALDLYMSEVAPFETVNVCQAFSLNNHADVTLKASDAFSFKGETASQIITIEE